jgi:choline-sulfatase
MQRAKQQQVADEPLYRGMSLPRALGITALVLVVVAVVGWASLKSAGVFDKPTGRELNVLLITTDTTRADYLGCMGHREARTPKIDWLAREGTLFERCYATTSVTLPSHTSILSGRNPYTHGVRTNGAQRAPTGLVTLAERLRDVGYRTSAVVAAYVVDEIFGLDQGFEHYSDVDAPIGEVDNQMTVERPGDEVADEAIKQLDQFGDERFFMWVHFFDPHHPYESKFVLDRNTPKAYSDEIAFMDEQIGRIISKLQQMGRLDDTLICVVADHGEAFGEHDEIGHQYFAYQTTLHVAWALRCPDVVPAEQRLDAVVRTIDIAPTILDILELPPLKEADGVSVWPWVRGDAAAPDLGAYGEAMQAYLNYRMSPIRTWTRGEWKLIHAPNPALYNIVEDPAELRNRILDHPEIADALRDELRMLIADAPPPPPNDLMDDEHMGDVGKLLESLGYAGSGKTVAEDVAEIEMFEPTGEDPAEYAGIFAKISMELPPLLSQGKIDEAISILKEMVEQIPDAPFPCRRLAMLYSSEGQPEEARYWINRAVELAPSDVALKGVRGAIRAELKEYEAALADFTQVIEQQPRNVGILQNAARVEIAMGQLDKADGHVELILKSAPNEYLSLVVIGSAFEGVGELERAHELYRQALEINPDCQACAEALERVATKLGW